MDSKRFIVSGNFFYEKAPIMSAGSDYRIIETDGKTYFYRYKFTDSEEITVLSPTAITPESETAWEELPLAIREEHYNQVFPNGSDEETKILFIYGNKEGQKILDDKWADTHIIHSKELTLAIIKRIGRFNNGSLLRTSLTSNTSRVDVYLLDEKWEVTIFSSGTSYSYQIEDYQKSLISAKEYGKKVRKLSNSTGVPYEVARLIGDISENEEALNLLNKIKDSRRFVTETRKKELLSGNRNAMNRCLRTILGNETMRVLNLQSRKKIVTLASYLAEVTN